MMGLLSRAGGRGGADDAYESDRNVMAGGFVEVEMLPAPSFSLQNPPNDTPRRLDLGGGEKPKIVMVNKDSKIYLIDIGTGEKLSVASIRATSAVAISSINVLACRHGNRIYMFHNETGSIIKSHDWYEYLYDLHLLKWIQPLLLAIVTTNSISHWDTPGNHAVKPRKIRTIQHGWGTVHDYCISPCGEYGLLTGDNKLLLFSTHEPSLQRTFIARAGIFASYQGNLVLVVASVKENQIDLHAEELFAEEHRKWYVSVKIPDGSSGRGRIDLFSSVGKGYVVSSDSVYVIDISLGVLVAMKRVTADMEVIDLARCRGDTIYVVTSVGNVFSVKWIEGKEDDADDDVDDGDEKSERLSSPNNSVDKDSDDSNKENSQPVKWSDYFVSDDSSSGDDDDENEKRKNEKPDPPGEKLTSVGSITGGSAMIQEPTVLSNSRSEFSSKKAVTRSRPRRTAPRVKSYKDPSLKQKIRQGFVPFIKQHCEDLHQNSDLDEKEICAIVFGYVDLNSNNTIYVFEDMVSILCVPRKIITDILSVLEIIHVVRWVDQDSFLMLGKSAIPAALFQLQISYGQNSDILSETTGLSALTQQLFQNFLSVRVIDAAQEMIRSQPDQLVQMSASLRRVASVLQALDIIEIVASDETHISLKWVYQLSPDDVRKMFDVAPVGQNGLDLEREDVEEDRSEHTVVGLDPPVGQNGLDPDGRAEGYERLDPPEVEDNPEELNRVRHHAAEPVNQVTDDPLPGWRSVTRRRITGSRAGNTYREYYSPCDLKFRSLVSVREFASILEQDGFDNEEDAYIEYTARQTRRQFARRTRRLSN